MHLISNCKITHHGTVSDHTSLLLKFRLSRPKRKNCKKREFINWTKLTKISSRASYNEKIVGLTSDYSNNHSTSPSYDDFNQMILQAADATLKEEKTTNVGWFAHSAHILSPLFTRRNKLLKISRKDNTNCPILREQCIDARKTCNDAIDVAKGRWAAYLGQKIHEMKFTPKIAWQSIKLLQKGFSGHHHNKIQMNFLLPNGQLSSSDAEHLQILQPHFHKVYNRNAKVNIDIVKKTPNRPTLASLDLPLTFSEFEDALKKLTWHKAPGINHISPNALKALNDSNRRILFHNVEQWWNNDSIDHPEWHEAGLRPLPKSGDLTNPNNWRGIVLMEVTSKLVTILINTRLQKLLHKYSIPYQFGGVPSTGCQDAVFCLKNFLQERRDKNKDSWCLFLDLVKAYDTIRHDIIHTALEKFGCPTHLNHLISRLYKEFKVVLKLG